MRSMGYLNTFPNNKEFCLCHLAKPSRASLALPSSLTFQGLASHPSFANRPGFANCPSFRYLSKLSLPVQASLSIPGDTGDEVRSSIIYSFLLLYRFKTHSHLFDTEYLYEDYEGDSE